MLWSFGPNSYDGEITRDSRQKSQLIKALAIPLTVHYAALLACECYRGKMQFPDFQQEPMKSRDLPRAYFHPAEKDVAYMMGPLVMQGDVLKQPVNINDFAHWRFNFDDADQEMDNDRV